MGENLGYALIQIAHNFGAVAVLGGAVCALSPVRRVQPGARGIAWLVLAGWLVQITSGVAFGVASFIYYGRLPDIHGVAVAALLIKIGCAISGAALSVVYLKRQALWSGRQRTATWTALATLAAIALSAAALLRWFS